MTWHVALCIAEGQECADSLQASLERMNPSPDATVAVEIDESSDIWEVGGYFDRKPDSVSLALLAEAFGTEGFTVSEIADEDWAAKVNRQLPPVQAGRFIVHGSHLSIDAGRGEMPILIDASLAFGTGHHATTQLCLELIDALHREGFDVSMAADIGCGTGILAIAIAELWQCRVDCGDNDPAAVEISRLNAAANGMSRLVSAQTAEGAPGDRFPAGSYGLVTANILSEPLISLAPELTRLLCPDGCCILSGITADQASGVISVYQDHGATLEFQKQRGSWVSLVFSS